MGSPITNEYLVADLARDWPIPAISSGGIRLGCLSQITAHIALARLLQIDCQGIILNQLAPDLDRELFAPIPLIENLVPVPVLGVLPFVRNWSDPMALAQAFASLGDFPMEKLLLGR
ncbi:MAG: AAA family ATPase [Pseudanabaenaceae cyanobacterium]